MSDSLTRGGVLRGFIDDPNKIQFFKNNKDKIYQKLHNNLLGIEFSELKKISKFIPKDDVQKIFDTSMDGFLNKRDGSFIHQLKLIHMFQDRGIDLSDFNGGMTLYPRQQMIFELDSHNIKPSYIGYYIGATMKDKNSSFFDVKKFGERFIYEPNNSYNSLNKVTDFEVSRNDALTGETSEYLHFRELKRDISAANDFELDIISHWFKNMESILPVSLTINRDINSIKRLLIEKNAYKKSVFNNKFQHGEDVTEIL